MKEGKMGKKKTDLTQGNITLQLLQFGLPIVVSMILQNLYNVADSLVVGRFIGDHALAAVGSTTSVSQFVLLLMGGATTGMGVIVSQYYGAGKEEEKKCKTCDLYFILYYFNAGSGAWNPWSIIQQAAAAGTDGRSGGRSGRFGFIFADYFLGSCSDGFV